MKKLLLFIALTIFGLGLNAQNVGDVTTIDYDGYSLEFTITSVELAKCEVSDYTGEPVDVTIPSAVTILGTECSVTSIGANAFSYRSSLTSIEIPNSVTSIGERAFKNCSGLESVTFEENSQLTSIGSSAFSDCSSLTSIEIPNSVTSIGEWAFSDCSSLTSIVIPNSVTSIEHRAFLGCSSLKVIKCHAENVPETGSYVFHGCHGIIICVPENSVEDYKADYPWNNYYITTMSEISVIEYDGYSLIYIITDEENTECMVACAQEPTMPTSITIPSSVEIKGIEYSVTSIGSGAFSHCSSLTSIEIPNYVTSIGEWAFSSCSSLTSIEIPNSVTSIGDYAFSYCSSLKVIKCHAENVPETGSDVFFGCHGIIICVPENSVEDYKAEHPWNNYYITAMSEISVIEYDGYSLIYIITDEENTECMVACAQEPTMPTSITIPSSVEIKGIEYSVTSIGDYAFSYCSSLTSVTFGENSQLTSIGERAFSYCSSLTSVTFGENSQLTSIGAEAFSDCSSLTSVTFGENSQLTFIGGNAFRFCSSLTSITFGENSQLTSIGEDAFSYCSSLTSIEIPNSVTSIGEWAFSYCSSLTSIEIPNSVTSIGEWAFSSCSSLTSVTFGENSQLTSIGERAFYECSSLTSIEIPNSVTSIGYMAFGDCSSLTSIEIPNSVTSIGKGAFYNCSSLTSITFGENSQLTSIGDYAFYNCSSLKIIKCYAEDVPETGDYVFDYCPSDMIIYVPEVSLEDYKATSPWNEFTILSLEEEEDDENENPTDTIVPEPEVLAVPENLVAKAESSSSILLTWDEVENANSYNIYQDDELIDETEETEYLVEDLEADTKYCFYVTAVNGSKESDESDEDCDRTDEEDEESIEELSSSIKIYPNPVDNELFLATELRVEEIAIYDVYGRLCCRDASNASTSNSMDTFNVSVQDLEAGVYFVKVVTNEGEIVKRFVKN